MMQADVVVLGGGAAGLMCAIEAGKRGRRVIVAEHTDGPGKKILISGGGRCNFTNLHCKAENFLSANPHFAKSALARYRPADFIRLVEKHGIPYHEKTLGQLFCDRHARDILNLLESECRQAGVDVRTGCAVTSVAGPGPFRLETSHGVIEAPALVVATGGLSIPKMGATPFGYELAKRFGLPVAPCRPALVPFTLDEEGRTAWCDLSGVSAEVVARAATGPAFREKMLVTHRGLSGPAILQVSSYWRPGETVAIDLCPSVDLAGQLKERKNAADQSTLRNALLPVWPRRFVDRFLARYWTSDPDRPLTRMTNADLETFARRARAWAVRPAGTEGYDKAEVTAGGVDTNALSSQTMEARNVPGLYFIGEVVDVTGHLGGFNFQWAWASGFAAGQAV